MYFLEDGNLAALEARYGSDLPRVLASVARYMSECELVHTSRTEDGALAEFRCDGEFIWADAPAAVPPVEFVEKVLAAGGCPVELPVELVVAATLTSSHKTPVS